MGHTETPINSNLKLFQTSQTSLSFLISYHQSAQDIILLSGAHSTVFPKNKKYETIQ
jgi:hypothetical protein